MIRKNINDIQMRRCILLDKLVFFTEDRVDRRDLPDNVYVYELRHKCGDVTTPIELANSVTVDFYGTVLVNEPCPVDLDNCYITIGDKDFIIYDRDDQSFMYEDPVPYDYFAAKDVCIWTYIPDELVHPIDVPNKPIKLFISQPFTGYDDNEIRKQRKLLHELYALYVNRPIEDIILIDQLDVVDAYDIEAHFNTSNDRSFYQLCRSVGMMKDADVVLFYGEWTKSKGAMIEHDICQRYKKHSVGNKELIEFCKNNPKYDDDYFMPLWKKQFFDIHEIADVNISRDPKGGFKATAELNCNGYTAIGDTPNDAYIALYSKLDDAAHDIVTKQIDSLKDSNVTVVICDDAETVTDEELINMHKDNISARDEGTPASESEIVLPDISTFHIWDPCGLLDKDTEKYPLFIHDEHNSHPLIINHKVLTKFMYDIKKPMKIEVSFGFGDMSGGYGVFKPDELCVHVAATTLTCTKKVRNDANSIIEIRSKDIDHLRYAKVTIWAK